MQFTNPSGDSVTLNPSEKLNVEYDILNFWNFPQGLGYKVKVGTFSPSSPPGQQLSLLEDRIEWNTGDGEVGGMSHYALQNTDHLKINKITLRELQTSSYIKR